MNDYRVKKVQGSERGTGAKLSCRPHHSLTNKASDLLGAVESLASSVSFKGVLITGLLLMMVLLSAIGVVYSSHLSRQLFSEQAILLEKNDQLQLEWAQLLLEQSAWSSPNRIEAVASDKLGMMMAEAGQIELTF